MKPEQCNLADKPEQWHIAENWAKILGKTQGELAKDLFGIDKTIFNSIVNGHKKRCTLKNMEKIVNGINRYAQKDKTLFYRTDVERFIRGCISKDEDISRLMSQLSESIRQSPDDLSEAAVLDEMERIIGHIERVMSKARGIFRNRSLLDRIDKWLGRLRDLCNILRQRNSDQ